VIMPDRLPYIPIRSRRQSSIAVLHADSFFGRLFARLVACITFPFLGGCSRKLEWPTLEQILQINQTWSADGDDDHLLLGMDASAIEDYLEAICWPQGYTRSEKDKKRNGILVPGEETGYDLAAYIRESNKAYNYELFSVAEILFSAGHPGVGPALGFLSHVQQERVTETLQAMREAALHLESCWRFLLVWWGWVRFCPLFLDYVSLRQNQDDFKEHKIREAIKKIGHTMISFGQPQVKSKCCATCLLCMIMASMAGIITYLSWLNDQVNLKKHVFVPFVLGSLAWLLLLCRAWYVCSGGGQDISRPKVFDRIFCVCELVASSSENATVVPIGAAAWFEQGPMSVWCCETRSYPSINLANAEASNPQDKRRILSFLDDVSHVNKILNRILPSVRRVTVCAKWTRLCLCAVGGIGTAVVVIVFLIWMNDQCEQEKFCLVRWTSQHQIGPVIGKIDALSKDLQELYTLFIRLVTLGLLIMSVIHVQLIKPVTYFWTTRVHRQAIRGMNTDVESKQLSESEGQESSELATLLRCECCGEQVPS